MAVRSRPRPAKSRRAAPKAQKWVYLFANKKAEGNAKMRDLLGGKGAGLAEISRLARSSRRASGTRSRRHWRPSSARRRKGSAIRRTRSSSQFDPAPR